MLLVLVPLVVVVVALVWAAGARRAAVIAGGAVAGLLVLATLVGGVVELREDADDEAEAGGTATEVITPPVDLEGTRQPPPLRDADVVLVRPGDPFDVPAAITGVADGDVRVVEIAIEHQVSLHQCAAGRVTAERCAAGVIAAERVDASPVALVELRELISTRAGPVDCTEDACVLAAFDGTEPLVDVPLVFGGDRLVTPRVVVSPATGVEPGEEVTVTVADLDAGAGGNVAFCAADEDASRPDCGEDATAELVADRSGEGSATVRLAACRRTDRCALRFAADGAIPTYVELAFASPPGPDVADGQVAAGLAAAGGLLLAALVLVRRTDWTNPDGDPFAGIDVGHDDPFAGIDLSVDPDEVDRLG